MEVQERFDKLCQQLGLTNSCKADAWAFWERLVKSQLVVRTQQGFVL